MESTAIRRSPNVATKGFRSLLLTSFGFAILASVTLSVVRPANADSAVRASAAVAVFWVAIVVYAFIRFKKRGLWFLLGTPLVVFWFFLLFVIAWGCAHNVGACP